MLLRGLLIFREHTVVVVVVEERRRTMGRTRRSRVSRRRSGAVVGGDSRRPLQATAFLFRFLIIFVRLINEDQGKEKKLINI